MNDIIDSVIKGEAVTALLLACVCMGKYIGGGRS